MRSAHRSGGCRAPLPAVSQFGPAILSPIIADGQAPEVSNVVADPNPVSTGSAVGLSAGIDDSATGDSIVVGAAYTIDGGQETEMLAADPS